MTRPTSHVDRGQLFHSVTDAGELVREVPLEREEHPPDCGYCQAGEGYQHAYEPRELLEELGEVGEVDGPELAYDLEATPALDAGRGRVDQCARCGCLAATTDLASPRKLGPCPACGGLEWWHQRLPVGPFKAPR